MIKEYKGQVPKIRIACFKKSNCLIQKSSHVEIITFGILESHVAMPASVLVVVASHQDHLTGSEVKECHASASVDIWQWLENCRPQPNKTRHTVLPSILETDICVCGGRHPLILTPNLLLIGILRRNPHRCRSESTTPRCARMVGLAPLFIDGCGTTPGGLLKPSKTYL